MPSAGDRAELIEILSTQLQEPGPTPLWNAISVGMTGLVHEEGRRVVLVFTDGVDAPGMARPNNQTLGDVTRRSREEDVMVYAVELESTDDLGSTFARVADELHRQYALGFVPEKLDGKTHKLEVRIKRIGLTARTRRSYVARP